MTAASALVVHRSVTGALGTWFTGDTYRDWARRALRDKLSVVGLAGELLQKPRGRAGQVQSERRREDEEDLGE